MHVLPIVTIIYLLISVGFVTVHAAWLHRLFLASSNLFVIPAFLEALNQQLWFESSFLGIMATVSLTYHITFGLAGAIGVWFRRVDWLFALATGPVFLNYFFMHKYSYGKMVSNFWILGLIAIFTNDLMDNAFIYGMPLTVYVLILFFTRRRHFTNLTTKNAIAVLAWSVVGVALFFLADHVMYWLFHTDWHVCIFVGIYYLLLLGCLDNEPVKQQYPPVYQTNADVLNV
jgi:hypothetical protein